MSNKDKEQELEATEVQPESVDESSAPDVEEPALEPEPEDKAIDEESVPADAVPAKRGGNGVAWLALLISVLAAAAIGYSLSQDWLETQDTTTKDALTRLESRLAASDASRDELAAEIVALDQAGNAELDDLRQEMDQRVHLFSSLPDRMSALESSVASLAGISESSRDAWLIAEAEYYMQIANVQLQLANNPELAALALRMADERVVQMGNPALIDVRQAISDELAALDVMEKPDISGATMTLASLAQVVEALPLAAESRSESESDASTDDEQNGFRRAWASMKRAMSGLVRVTPPDQAKLALVSPDAEMFLRNNLALQLQSARLALLRGEQAVFEQSIDDTSALLTQYFDGDSAQVKSTQETLAEIRSNVFTSSAPDISGSLQLLRQFRTLRETSQ